MVSSPVQSSTIGRAGRRAGLAQDEVHHGRKIKSIVCRDLRLISFGIRWWSIASNTTRAGR